MLRKSAAFALGLLLFVAVGIAVAHAHALKAPGTSEFSAPCEPASPAFKAAGAKALSSLDWSFDANTAEAPGGVTRPWRADAFVQPPVVSALRSFPPLLRRPPPFAA